MKIRERVQRRRALKTLTRLGFTQGECDSLSNRDLQQLWEWMRGSTTPLVTFVGLSYGMFFGAVPPVVAAHWLLNQGGAGIYILVLASLASLALFAVFGMIFAWSINERLVSRADYFYSYGQVCRGLISVGTYSPRTLNSRKYLAKAIGRWVEEAEAKQVAIQPFRTALELMVKKPTPSSNDLVFVSKMGRALALAPMRGKIDMLALTPTLLAGRDKSRAKAKIEELAKILGAAVPYIAFVTALLKFWP